MRPKAYHLFEIVAWPAAVWCAIEIGLRAATASYDGAAMTAATGALAAMTVVACRWRSAQLAPARSTER
jgi:hypothetical protein